jgi:hypothetical protein
MITAKQAKEKTEDAIRSTSNAFISRINTHIEEAIEDHEYKCIMRLNSKEEKNL